MAHLWPGGARREPEAIGKIFALAGRRVGFPRASGLFRGGDQVLPVLVEGDLGGGAKLPAVQRQVVMFTVTGILRDSRPRQLPVAD